MNKTGFLFLPLAALSLGTINLRINSSKEKEEFVQIIGTIKEGEEYKRKTFNELVYSTNPTSESLYRNQSVSINHVGSINTVWDHYRGDGVTIAVIDTGISYHHEDFWNDGTCNISNKSASFYLNGYNVIKEYVGNDYSNVGCIEVSEKTHGTSVSATAAATVSGYGTVGIAPNATILTCKVDLSAAAIYEAICYAADNGADVINMSLGAYDNPGSTIIQDYFQEAIDYAVNKGCIIIAAAGNESTNDASFPACCANVVGVGALAQNSSDSIAYYSNYNLNGRKENNVDIVAPGTVYTAVSCFDGNNVYSEGYIDGTSFASPITAGAAALYKQKYPSANHSSFESALFGSVRDLGSSGWDETFGFGALDIGALLNINEDETDIEFDVTTTKNQDATTIWWEDQIGWCFKTLHIYSLGFYQGYTMKDFQNYLTIELGNNVPRSGWTFQGTSRCWAFNVESTPGDYLIKVGGEGKTYELNLPWWVTNGVYQFVNNDNWKSDSGCYIYNGDSHYKAKIKSYIYGSGQVSTPNPDANETHDFKAVFVHRKAIDTNGNIVAEDSTFKTCVYDYFNASSSYDVEGYNFIRWYEDEDCLIPYQSRIIRKDITLYALVSVINGRVYFQSQDWGDTMYAYEYKVVDGAVIEALGSWPGKRMSVVNAVTFNNAGLWYVDINTDDDTYIIFNNNSHNQTPDCEAYDGLYYYLNNSLGEPIWDGSWDMGEAAILVHEIADAMDEVEASEYIKQGSVCGLANEAIDLIDKYNALESEGKAVFESATIYTYKRDLSDGKENVYFGDIINQLAKLSTGNTLPTGFSVKTSNEQDIILIVTVTIIAMSLLAVIIIKKKKSIR